MAVEAGVEDMAPHLSIPVAAMNLARAAAVSQHDGPSLLLPPVRAEAEAEAEENEQHWTHRSTLELFELLAVGVGAVRSCRSCSDDDDATVEEEVEEAEGG